METKRAFTPETIKELERRGLTMPGGGYPIETIGDLENAIQAFGRAKDPEKTKAWIIRRAHELGKTDLLPEQWIDKHEPDTDEDDSMKADAQATEHKVVPVGGFKVLDEDEGIAETIVSVTGIKDRVKDTILPGAYTKTLQERTPRGVWGHDWNTPISKTLEIKELMPGDSRLPKKLRNGKPWPAEAGALMVRTQFNLETQRGREAFSDVKFFGEDQEWSIGYNVPAGKAVINPKTGERQIKELVLHEYSPVLHGAMPEAVTQSVKSAQAAYAALEAAYPTDGLETETKDDYPVDDVEPTLSEADIATLFGDAAAEVEMDIATAESEMKRAMPGRSHRGNAETLRRYWSTGEGAAKIAWGTEGDFMRCVTHISKYMSPEKAKGYCNLLHHRSLGIWPAQHKDVANGSYPREINAGLAGSDDGSDEMTCPNCGGELDVKGCCMDKDCPMFQMDVKEAARAVLAMQVKAMLEDGILTLDELVPTSSGPVDPRTGSEAKVDITLDLMEADLLDMELEEKAAYIRKQRHGGWIWAGRGGHGGTPGELGAGTAQIAAQAARALSHEQGKRNLADAGPTGRGESTHADFTDVQARSAQQQFRGRGDVRRSSSVNLHDNGEGTPVTVEHGDKTMKLRPGVIEKIQPNFDASTIFGIEKHPTSGADFLAVAPLNAPREHYNEQGHKVSMQPSTEVAAAGGSPQDIRAALRGEHPDWTHQRVASAAARMHSDAQKPKPKGPAAPAGVPEIDHRKLTNAGWTPMPMDQYAQDQGMQSYSPPGNNPTDERMITYEQANPDYGTPAGWGYFDGDQLVSAGGTLDEALGHYNRGDTAFGMANAERVAQGKEPVVMGGDPTPSWKPEIDPNTGDLTADSLQKYVDSQKLPAGYTATVEPGENEYMSASIRIDGPGIDPNMDERASAIVVNPDGTVAWGGSRDYEKPSLAAYIDSELKPNPAMEQQARDAGIPVIDRNTPPDGFPGERVQDVGPGRAATPKEASIATAQDDLANGYPNKVSDANLRAIADMTDRHPDFDQHTTDLAKEELVKRSKAQTDVSPENTLSEEDKMRANIASMTDDQLLYWSEAALKMGATDHFAMLSTEYSKRQKAKAGKATGEAVTGQSGKLGEFNFGKEDNVATRSRDVNIKAGAKKLADKLSAEGGSGSKEYNDILLDEMSKAGIANGSPIPERVVANALRRYGKSGPSTPSAPKAEGAVPNLPSPSAPSTDLTAAHKNKLGEFNYGKEAGEAGRSRDPEVRAGAVKLANELAQKNGAGANNYNAILLSEMEKSGVQKGTPIPEPVIRAALKRYGAGAAPKASGNSRPFDTALTDRQKAQIPAELQDASYDELASWFESHGNPRAAAFLRRKAGGSKEVWVDEYEVKDVFDALAEYARLTDEGVI